MPLDRGSQQSVCGTPGLCATKDGCFDRYFVFFDCFRPIGLKVKGVKTTPVAVTGAAAPTFAQTRHSRLGNLLAMKNLRTL